MMNSGSFSRPLMALILASTLLGLAGCAPAADHNKATLAELLGKNLPEIDDVKAMIDGGQIHAARDALQQMRVQQPENLEVAFLLGEVLLKLHNPDGALGHYEAAIASPEKRALALQGAGLALLQLGRTDDASTKLEEAVAADASLWRALNALARVYDARHDWSAAETAYRNAIAANPNQANLYNNLGMSYLLQHRFDEAIAEFQRAITLDPGLKVARTNMRMAYALQGRYVQALAGVPERELPNVLNNVGYAALLRGEYDTARSYLARAIEISPAYHREASANLQQLEGLVSLAAAEAE
jgi:Flp pilus assembly protein TadD